MNRKIELYLRAAADFRDFCEPDASFAEGSCPGDELSEGDLDLIAAAANIPTHTNASLPDKE